MSAWDDLASHLKPVPLAGITRDLLINRALEEATGPLLQEIAELQQERQSTNAALSRAMEDLQVARDELDELRSLKPVPIQQCRRCGAGYTYGTPCPTCRFHELMDAARAEVQARRGREDTYVSELHHDYAVPHDLPASTHLPESLR